MRHAGVDLGNLLAAELVLDRGRDQLGHTLRMFMPVSHDHRLRVSARRWPAGTSGRAVRRNDGSIRSQRGSPPRATSIAGLYTRREP